MRIRDWDWEWEWDLALCLYIYLATFGLVGLGLGSIYDALYGLLSIVRWFRILVVSDVGWKEYLDGRSQLYLG